MNDLVTSSEALIAEIKEKAKKFAEDNYYLALPEDYAKIEAAMTIGALIASGYFAKLDSEPVEPNPLLEKLFNEHNV